MKRAVHKVSLVLLEWEDSARPSPAWQLLEDVKAPSVVICRSVGWLIGDTKRTKVLAPNMGVVDGEEDVMVSGAITIPTRAVLKTLRLREPA